MRRSRIALWSLSALVTVIAIFLGALVNANELLWRIAHSATLFALIGGAAYAFAAPPRQRAVAAAFVVCTWSYLLFHSQISGMENDLRSLFMTQGLHLIWSAISVENPDFDPQLAMRGESPGYTPEWGYFADIGVILVAVLCGLFGASLVAICRRSDD